VILADSVNRPDDPDDQRDQTEPARVPRHRLIACGPIAFGCLTEGSPVGRLLCQGLGEHQPFVASTAHCNPLAPRDTVPKIRTDRQGVT
jgi:hypothetical protein